VGLFQPNKIDMQRSESEISNNTFNPFMMSQGFNAANGATPNINANIISNKSSTEFEFSSKSLVQSSKNGMKGGPSYKNP
jgi:hypothetical protein